MQGGSIMTTRVSVPTTIIPLLLAACSGGGSQSQPTPNTTSGYPLGAPAAASLVAGPTASGTTITSSPAGTVFPLSQSVYQFLATAGSADTQTMAGGATATVVNLADGTFELKIPNL